MRTDTANSAGATAMKPSNSATRVGQQTVRTQGLVSFVYAFLLFYWSSAVVPVLHWRQVLNFRGPRCDMFLWARFMMQFFQCKVMRVGPNVLHKPTKGKVAYLCNHRSWADFFIDAYLTEGNAAMLSSISLIGSLLILLDGLWLVFWVFPVFMATPLALRRMLLFKRGHVGDKEKFNAWLDSKLADPLVPGLLVYPEGHRSTKPESLPLKRGMLHYIHSRKIPVQLVISRGKEDAWSEKHLAVNWGAIVTVSYSQLISAEGKEFEVFAAEINTVWTKLWKEVFAADEKTAVSVPLMRLEDVPRFDYPMIMRMQQACAAYLFALPIFILFVTTVVKVCLWLTMALGPTMQQFVLLAVLSLTVVSLKKKAQGS